MSFSSPDRLLISETNSLTGIVCLCLSEEDAYNVINRDFCKLGFDLQGVLLGLFDCRHIKCIDIGVISHQYDESSVSFRI